MTEAMTCEAIRLPIVKFCKLGSLTQARADSIIEGLVFASGKDTRRPLGLRRCASEPRCGRNPKLATPSHFSVFVAQV